MTQLVHLSRRVSPPLMRVALGVVLAWIGALKFADPAPVVGLLEASFRLLAGDAFVYLLGAVEVAAGLALLAGVGLPLVGLLCLGLFAGTLTIFMVAPGVSYGEAGFPFLTLPGEFLLKDLVLFAVAAAVPGMEPAAAREAAPAGAEAAPAR
jgi:putative oxidoreductase